MSLLEVLNNVLVRGSHKHCPKVTLHHIYDCNIHYNKGQKIGKFNINIYHQRLAKWESLPLFVLCHCDKIVCEAKLYTVTS